jgi:hypothetical protein
MNNKYIYVDFMLKFVKMWTRIQCVKYNQNNQVKEDEMGRACSTYGENRNPYMILVGKSERKRRLGISKRRWKDNIKINHSTIWTGLFSLRIGTGRTLF